ncbi:MAG: CsgG/HfaB family protein [Syntrophales bacterium]
MKRVTMLLVTAFVFLSSSFAFAADPPRIGVLRFTNRTSAGWWSGSMGSELQDMLATELSNMKVFQVLERKEINAVLGEQDLGASGRIDAATKAKIGKIKGARYLVSGSVSAFEQGTSGTGAGIGFMGVSIGGKKETAYMAIDLKVIDTTTGEIADSRTVEATSESSGLRLGANIAGLSGDLGKQDKTPVGKAIRACIIESAEYLECSLVKGKADSCMKEYAEKESKRREKTKKAITLD